jgi:hypothetical protein
VAAEHRRIAVGLVAAAIGAAPRGPARLVCLRLHRRRLEHRGIGEGDVGGQRRVALGGKAERGAARAGDAAASVDERIEHQVEELAPHLEAGLLRAGRGLAGELRERVAEIGAGQSEDGDEAGRQRAAVVEEAVERIGDVELVAAQGAIRQRLLSRCRGLLSQHRGEIQDRVGAGIAERRREARRQA